MGAGGESHSNNGHTLGKASGVGWGEGTCHHGDVSKGTEGGGYHGGRSYGDTLRDHHGDSREAVSTLSLRTGYPRTMGGAVSGGRHLQGDGL